MYIFIIYFLSALFWGSFMIGPLSVRVYSTIIFALYLFVCHKAASTNKNRLDYTPIFIYLFYIIFVLILKLVVDAIRPEIDETTLYLKRIIAFYFVGIIGFIGVDKIFFKKKQFNTLVWTLICFLIFNSIVSFLQYFGQPIGINIAVFFSSNNEFLETTGILLKELSSKNIPVPGLLGHGVTNGYVNASYAPLALYMFLNNKGFSKYLGLISFLIFASTAFIIQERAPMGLLIMLTIYTIYKFRPNYILLSIPLVVIGSLLYLPEIIDFANSGTLGRFTKMNDFGDDRRQLVSNALSFINENFVLGGEYYYAKLFGLVPHNFFLHSIVIGGIFGALIIIFLFLYLLKDAFNILLYTKKVSYSFFFSGGLAIYLLNGLLHSGTLLTGDVSILVLYALMMRSLKLKI